MDFGAGIPNPKIQNPQSKLFWPWILDFGSLCSNSLCEAPTPHILDFGGDFESWILEVGDTGFWILDLGDFGFWRFGILGILDVGFLEHYVADLYVQSLDFGIWGFWILGILDFGFWRFLEFGALGILDWQVLTKFWMLHKKRRLCTPNRVGGFS